MRACSTPAVSYGSEGACYRVYCNFDVFERETVLKFFWPSCSWDQLVVSILEELKRSVVGT